MLLISKVDFLWCFLMSTSNKAYVYLQRNAQECTVYEVSLSSKAHKAFPLFIKSHFFKYFKSSISNCHVGKFAAFFFTASVSVPLLLSHADHWKIFSPSHKNLNAFVSFVLTTTKWELTSRETP